MLAGCAVAECPDGGAARVSPPASLMGAAHGWRPGTRIVSPLVDGRAARGWRRGALLALQLA
jgi:hypothetical protein